MSKLKDGKTCSVCKVHKGYAGFGKKSIFKDGLEHKCLVCANKYRMDCYYKNPISSMIVRARSRAKDKNLEFTISSSDIIIPNICPILNTEIRIGREYSRDDSPSIDRIDNSKGYTPDNIQVISYRANRLKSDATFRETCLLYEYLKRMYYDL